ncbi:MAG: sigma-70 family RNA polymerase sigma factor [Gemmatirosa sp.]|nr:sigma-70 family RNA polymerase sigma factor [Gemmatirosa sp.]
MEQLEPQPEPRPADAAGALNALFPVVYDELRRLAGRYLRDERAGHTLQATALVHEAWMRLVDQRRLDVADRAQFFGAAAETMRRILVNHARDRKAAKRGGGATPITLGAALRVAGAAPDDDLLAVDDALTALAALDPRQARVVELRYFAGLSIEETGEVLGVSPATVKREWATAKAWLRHAMTR